jgi:hypothetical protein
MITKFPLLGLALVWPAKTCAHGSGAVIQTPAVRVGAE